MGRKQQSSFICKHYWNEDGKDGTGRDGLFTQFLFLLTSKEYANKFDCMVHEMLLWQL